jgi:IclR family transcriptional regulator, pca regulon regulatory protein
LVKSAVRTVAILSLLASSDRPLLNSEIADGLQIPSSSLTALLSDLVDLRYLARNEETKRYSLGPAVLSLSSAYLKNLDLAKVAEPFMRALFDGVREFTSLVIPNGMEVTKVSEYAVDDPFAMHLKLGESGPYHATACGKALLAFANAEQRRRMLSQLELRAYTHNTILDRDALRADVEKIRRTGLAFCREEYLEGSTSVGAPIFDATEEVVAAVGVNTRTVRFTEAFADRASALLLSTARDISSRLGSVRAVSLFDGVRPQRTKA